MSDLLGLVGFDGDFAGEQVLHEPGSLCDLASLRDTFFFTQRR